jgi:hypothetical protein
MSEAVLEPEVPPESVPTPVVGSRRRCPVCGAKAHTAGRRPARPVAAGNGPASGSGPRATPAIERSGAPPASFGAKQVTSTIPIVMGGVAADPVETGLVASLARPGDNITRDEYDDLATRRAAAGAAREDCAWPRARGGILESAQSRLWADLEGVRGGGPNAGCEASAPGSAGSRGLRGCLQGGD